MMRGATGTAPPERPKDYGSISDLEFADEVKKLGII